MRRALLPLLCTALLGACFAGTDLTDAGNGIPQVAVDFPDKTKAGSVRTATLTVTNPGPGGMPVMDVTFARVGTEAPLIDDLSRRPARAIVSAAPEPLSFDGVAYRFEGPPEGQTVAVEFQIRIPPTAGVVANSLTVSDPQDPQRARGVRLATSIER
jgi:hypothetical protein